MTYWTRSRPLIHQTPMFLQEIAAIHWQTLTSKTFLTRKLALRMSQVTFLPFNGPLATKSSTALLQQKRRLSINKLQICLLTPFSVESQALLADFLASDLESSVPDQLQSQLQGRPSQLPLLNLLQCLNLLQRLQTLWCYLPKAADSWSHNR